MRAGRRRAGVAAAVAAAISVAGCDDEGPLRSAEGLLATAESMDFGPVLVGSAAEDQLWVENVGSGPLRVLGVQRIHPFPAEFAVEAPETPLLPGERRAFSVQFAPGEVGPRRGLFRLRTDSRVQPDVAVTVTGRGVLAEAAPDALVLDFGNVPVMSAETRVLTLSNSGEVDAVAVASLPTGTDADLFHPALSGRLSVSPGGTLSISVEFRPTRLGPAEAAISLIPCPTCAALAVRLVGAGVASVLTTSPAAVDFGFVPVGAPPTCRIVTLQNIGSALVGFLGAEAQPAPPFSATPLFAQTLPAGGAVDVEVCFAPLAYQAYSGTLVLRTSDGRAPKVYVPLAGVGGGPEVQCAPAALDFGTQILGATHTLRVLCTNLGTDLPGGGGELVLRRNTATTLGTRILGDAEFAVSLPTDVRLLAGESYVLDVIYRPIDASADVGKLVIATNDADEPEIEIPLRGTAREAAPCAFEIIPPRLDFGLVAVGQNPTLDFQVWNVGGDACVFNDLDLTPASDPAFRLSKGPLPSTTVWPGDRLRVPVEFWAADARTAEGMVQFYVGGASSPLVLVPLSAIAGEGCLTITPGLLSFGRVGVDCTAPQRAVTLVNTCAFPVTVDSVALGVGTSTEFGLGSWPAPGSVSLQPGEVRQLTVWYDPWDDGQDSAPLYVQVAGETAPRLVALVGKGDQSPQQRDLFQQDVRPKADVLFVMDNSGSMMEEQDGLGRGFPQFMSAAIAGNWDFHIAVTTTGIRASAPSCPGGADGGEAGRLFPVDSSTARIITPMTPDPMEAFRKNIAVGLCHWWEEGLEAAYLALSEPLVSSADDPRTALPGDGNAGFLRPDARLSVIYISDEDDFSPRPVSDYVAHLRSLKPGRPDLLSVSAIVSDGGCTTASSIGARYMQVVQQVGGVVASICSPDWNAVLQSIAGTTFAGRSRFSLSQRPSAQQILVRVDGVEVPQLLPSGERAWSYDAATNEVVFDPGHVPPAGSQVEIVYPVACP